MMEIIHGGVWSERGKSKRSANERCFCIYFWLMCISLTWVKIRAASGWAFVRVALIDREYILCLSNDRHFE